MPVVLRNVMPNMSSWRWQSHSHGSGYRRVASTDSASSSCTSSSGLGADDFKDALLPTLERDLSPPRRLPWKPRLSARRVVLLFALALAACVFFGFFMSTHTIVLRKPLPPPVEITYAHVEETLPGDRRFVIVIPVDSPSPDLCKLITSAIALGYPAPVIVNWGKDFHKSDKDFGASHLGKISGTLEYLDGVTSKGANPGNRLDENDLVLVVDAYDIWFQLPPEVLLSRYHETNKLANARLTAEWGSDEAMPMRQTILVSSQQRCYPEPDSGSDQHCDAVPYSPLRPDLYGEATDMNPAKKYHETRPRWVNSGSIMGPAGDMRRYFRRAKEKMERGLSSGLALHSDQGIFGEVFGEQEVWRTWRRDWHNIQIPSGLHDSMDEGSALIQGGFEFHVGLDYTQNLFLPTIYKEDDGQWVHLNNETVIEQYSIKLGVPAVRLHGVPEDLKGVRNPLADVKGAKAKGWGEMALYADFFTTAVPALVHHNAWKNHLKERRVTYWDRTWYFPHLRTLLNKHLQPAPLTPLVKIPATKGNFLKYWAQKSESEKRRPRRFDANRARHKEGFEEMAFESVCRYPDTEAGERHWWEEVFRDGKGGI